MCGSFYVGAFHLLQVLMSKYIDNVLICYWDFAWVSVWMRLESPCLTDKHKQLCLGQSFSLLGYLILWDGLLFANLIYVMFYSSLFLVHFFFKTLKLFAGLCHSGCNTWHCCHPCVLFAVQLWTWCTGVMLGGLAWCSQAWWLAWPAFSSSAPSPCSPTSVWEPCVSPSPSASTTSCWSCCAGTPGCTPSSESFSWDPVPHFVSQWNTHTVTHHSSWF